MLLAGCRQGFGDLARLPAAVTGTPAAETAPAGNSTYVLPGRVVDASGQPVPGVPVRAWPSDALPPGSRASLIANDAAGLVAHDAAGLVGNDAAGRRATQQATDLVVSDASGSFRLDLPAGRYNLEAIRSATAKGWLTDVAVGPGSPPREAVLRTLPTGRVTGRVLLPVSPGASKPLFVTEAEVLVVGSSYKARPDATGHFSIDDVPVGILHLLVWHPVVGASRPWGATQEVPVASGSLVLDDVRPAVGGGWVAIPAEALPRPTASPGDSPVPTIAPTPSPAPTPEPTPSPAATAAPLPSSLPTEQPSASPGATALPEPTASPTTTPAPTEVPAPSPQPSPQPSPVPSAIPTPSPTASPAPRGPGIFFLDGSLPFALQQAGVVTVDALTLGDLGVDSASPRHFLVGGVTPEANGGREATDSILMVSENSAGRIENIQVLPSRLRVPRRSAAAVVVPPYVYVIGGFDVASLDTPLASVERARLTADGLGPFESMGDLLDGPRARHSVARIGAWLFSIGGRTGPQDQDFTAVIARAPIGPDGTIGSFQPHASLLQPRAGAALVGPWGTQFHLMGGVGTDGNGQIRLSGSERLAFTENRSADRRVDLGSDPAGARGDALPTSRARFGHALLGDRLYVFGGWTGQAGTEVLSGTLEGDALSPLQDFAGARLAAGVDDAATLVTSQNIYVLGGSNPSGSAGVSLIQRAPILDLR